MMTVHPTPSSTVDAITHDAILTDRILRALREHYVIIRRFGGTEDTYAPEPTVSPFTRRAIARELPASDRTAGR